MRVVMLKPTSWDGRYLIAGDEVDIAADVGKRWIARKIAVPAPGERVDATDAADAGGALDGFTVAELRTLAKERNIDHAGKRKEELIELLKAVE